MFSRVIQVVAWIGSSFLFYGCIIFYRKYIPQFVHPSVNRHLGCFQLAAAVNICANVLVWLPVLNSLGYIPVCTFVLEVHSNSVYISELSVQLHNMWEFDEIICTVYLRKKPKQNPKLTSASGSVGLPDQQPDGLSLAAFYTGIPTAPLILFKLAPTYHPSEPRTLRGEPWPGCALWHLIKLCRLLLWRQDPQAPKTPRKAGGGGYSVPGLRWYILSSSLHTTPLCVTCYRMSENSLRCPHFIGQQ